MASRRATPIPLGRTPTGSWATRTRGPRGVGHLLEHRWSNCISYFGSAAVAHQHDYGLFDRTKLQAHWLERCEQGHLRWHRGFATTISHDQTGPA